MVRPSFEDSASNQPDFAVPSAAKSDCTNANEYFVAHVQEKVKEIKAIQRAGIPVAKPTIDEYPCIDISAWMDPSSSTLAERQAVVQQVLNESKIAGSFNIVGHGVRTSLFDELEQEGKTFFDKPLAEKLNYKDPNDLHKGGYLAVQSESAAAVWGKSEKEGEDRDLREIYGAVYPKSSHYNVPAPQGLQAKLDEYLESMTRLDDILHDIFTAALAMAKNVELDTHLLNKLGKAGATGVVRVSKYPKMTEAKYQGASKLNWHSDWSTLSLIYSNRPGLEELRDGRLVEVPTGQGRIHVACGETLSFASNGLFPDNIHRVSPTAADDRISLTYFAGQGERGTDTEAGQGMDPVCAPGETRLFTGKVSTTIHVDNYCKSYFSG